MNKIEMVTPADLQARLAGCLRQRRMPDHFLYVGEDGTENWLALERSPQFPVASRLTELLRQSAQAIAGCVPPNVSLVSIGVGDGGKERILLAAMLPRGVARYCAVDISSAMVDVALETVAELAVERTGIVAFLEDLPCIRPYWRSPVLLCLIGNNFCNYEPDVLLDAIHGELEAGDCFLLDCHLSPPQSAQRAQWRQRVEQAYRSAQNVRFNIGPLVRHGMRPEDCLFRLELTTVDTPAGPVLRTCKHIEVLRDSMLTFPGQDVPLAAGETIQMGFTCKYTMMQVESYLEHHHFEQISRFVSGDGENLVVLVRKS